MREYLKKAAPREERDLAVVRETVQGILDDVRKRGEEAVRHYSQRFDDWDPPRFRVSEEAIQQARRALPVTLVDDIRFAAEQVRKFADFQRQTLQSLEVANFAWSGTWAPAHSGRFRRVLRAGREVSADRIGSDEHHSS